MSLIRASLVLLALGLAACGVRGAPTPAPPLFGETDLPPLVPQPYQRGAATTNNFFAPTLGEYEVSEDFPETLPENRSIRSANPQDLETDEDGAALGD